MSAQFRFDLVSPERLLVATDAAHVVVPGAEGDFGVLAGHAPFMTTLRPGLLRIMEEDGAAGRELFLKGGFAEVNDDRLTILAEDAVDPKTVDAERLAADIRDAEEDLRVSSDAVEIDRLSDLLGWMRPLAVIVGSR